MAQDGSKTRKSLAPHTVVAKRVASARFRANHTEELREKARERMAKRRAALNTLDANSPEAKDVRERAQEARRKYREANRSKIVENQRVRRCIAFDRTHTIEESAARRMQQQHRREMVEQEETLKRIFKKHP
ncbi:hypothetical protein C8F01DRAFT_1368869 [Mycena amicta]|nr:hypothetical protein C8F01DRAFT_1368869 [Mycena amicta]